MEEPGLAPAAKDTAIDETHPSTTLLFFPSKQFSSRYGEQFFTVQIDSFRLSRSDKGSWVNLLLCLPPNQCVTYAVTVKCGKHTWTVDRRFSEFASIFGQEPGFPKKTAFPVYSENFLTTRKEQLNVFLSQFLERQCKASGDFTGNEKGLGFFNFSHRSEENFDHHEDENSASAAVSAPSSFSQFEPNNKVPMESISRTGDDEKLPKEQREVAPCGVDLSAKYEEILKEVGELKVIREELQSALEAEEGSHALRKKTVEDLQTRIDEEIVSYTHAKAFIEDLQIRLEEVLMARAVDKEAIDDMQLRLDEVVSANQSRDNQDILLGRVEDLQARLEEETVSYEHAKAFIEDLQIRVDDVLSSIETMKQQEIDLQSKIEIVSKSNAELRRQVPETTYLDSTDDRENTSDVDMTSSAQPIVNASPVSRETDSRPSSVSSPTNVEGIHNDDVSVAVKPIDTKVAGESDSSTKKATRKGSKKKRN